MGLFYNHNKSGSGIEKNAPEKNRIVTYFEILFRKFWKLIQVNLLYSVFIIPLVLVFYSLYFMNNMTSKLAVMAVGAIVFVLVFGPATAAVFKIMRSYSMERHSFILTDFKKAFSENYKKSLVMGIINIVSALSVYASIMIYPELAKTYASDLIYVPMVLSISVGIAIIFISFYSYLLIVATDVSFKNVIRNSIVLTVYSIKKSVISFLVTIVLVAAFVLLSIYNLYTLVALPFVPAAIIMFTITFNSYPVIQKYVINPYYEQKGEVNPELSDGITDEDEVLFEDMGGKEAPAENFKKDKKSKTKTIS